LIGVPCLATESRQCSDPTLADGPFAKQVVTKAGEPLDEMEQRCRDTYRRVGGLSISGQAWLEGLTPESRGFELPRAHSMTVRLFR
jgi:hypothetical protein